MHQPIEVEMGDGEPITFYISDLTRQIYATGGWPASPSFSHGDFEALRNGMTKVIRQLNRKPSTRSVGAAAKRAKSPPGWTDADVVRRASSLFQRANPGTPSPSAADGTVEWDRTGATVILGSIDRPLARYRFTPKSRRCRKLPSN